MKGLWELRVELKTREDIRGIARATRLAAASLRFAASPIRPGERLLDVRERAERYAGERSGECIRVFTSVNETAAHGAPDATVIRSGDLVTLDVSLRREGWFGDVARSFVVGKGSQATRWLLEAAREAAWNAALAVRCGGRLSEVAECVRRAALRYGCAVAEGCAGHGIGRALHEAPSLTYADPGVEGYLVPGMVLTVEPVLTFGGPALRRPGPTGDLVTADGSLAAQFEHTVAVVPEGAVLLDSEAGSG